jgi:hypothetical protein
LTSKALKLVAIVLLLLMLADGGQSAHFASASSGLEAVDILSVQPKPIFTGEQVTIDLQSQIWNTSGVYPLPNTNITLLFSAPITDYNLQNFTPPLSVVTNSGGNGTLYFSPSSPGTYCLGADILGYGETGAIAGTQCFNVYDMIYQQQGDANENITGTVEKSLGNEITPTLGASYDSFSTASGIGQTSKSGFAVFSYAISDLTYFDFSEGTTVISHSLITPDYVFNSNFTLQVAGYTFSDVRSYNNGLDGIGWDNVVNIYVTAPNGTKYSYPVSSSYLYGALPFSVSKPLPLGSMLRWVIMYYQNPVSGATYGVVTWTFTGMPSDTLGVGYSPTPVFSFPYNGTQMLDVNMSISMSTAGPLFGTAGTLTLAIQQNQALLSSGTESIYSFNNGVAQYFCTSIQCAMQNAFGGIIGAIQSFFTTAFQSFLDSIGLGWLYDALTYLGQALLLFWNLIMASLPYLAILFLMLNLVYIVQLDLAGLIEFYINIYGIVANLANFLIDFVNAVVDFIQGIFGGGAATGAGAVVGA